MMIIPEVAAFNVHDNYIEVIWEEDCVDYSITREDVLVAQVCDAAMKETAQIISKNKIGNTCWISS